MSVEDGIPETGQATETTQETHDWEKDYKALQAEYTTQQQRLKTFESDPDALIQFIQEKHPDLIAAEEADEEEEAEVEPDDDDRPMTRREFDAWKREQAQTEQQKTSAQQYETDLQKFLNGRELTAIGNRAIRAAQVKSPEELKAAVDEWFEYDDTRAKPKPRVPHVPTNGQAATDVPNWDEMTPGEINQYMAERVRGHQAQT